MKQSIKSKPVLFLDFDRTLFDTDLFYEWLGDDRFSRLLHLSAGKMPPPDFAEFMYPDSINFLNNTKKKFRLVLLTYSVNTRLQKLKVRGSGIIPFFHDVIITQHDKGSEAKDYLSRTDLLLGQHYFIDDAPGNIADMKAINPNIFCLRIERKTATLSQDLTIGDKSDVVVVDLIEAEVVLNK